MVAIVASFVLAWALYASDYSRYLAVDTNPRKRDTAVRLAERYFALATSEGDPRYVGYAQAALKRLAAAP